MSIVAPRVRSGVRVSVAESRQQRKEFFELPWKLYRHSPHWVPPIRASVKELLGWKRHPFLEFAEVQTFLARRRGQTVGRIAAILNHEHNRVHGGQIGFFGFFECVDDPRVAEALFDSVCRWFAAKNITTIRGPANPSLNYESGLLVEGFDSAPTFMMTYNPPYYADLIENYGFRKVQDLYAYVGYLHQLPQAQATLGPIVQQAKERLNAEVRPLNKRHFQQDVELFLEMWNRAGVANWGFVPLTRGEVRAHAAALKHLLIPELSLAGVCDGEVAGVVLGLPDFNPAVKAIDGRLFPLGFLKLLKVKRNVKRLRVLSIAVVPEYQRWGLGLVLMDALAPKALEIGVREAEFSWIVESNTLARAGLEKGGAEIYKTYRMYDYHCWGQMTQ